MDAFADILARLAAAEARLDALEGKSTPAPATAPVGQSGSMAVNAPPLQADLKGWVTPLNEKLGANVRKSTDVSAPLGYVLPYGDSREVSSTIVVPDAKGKDYLWYILADYHVVRGDVVAFSEKKPAPEAHAGLYPCPTKYDVFTNGHDHDHKGWDLATYHNRIGEPVYAGPNGGTVVQTRESGWNDGFGNYVIVRYDFRDLPYAFRSMLPDHSYVFAMHAHLSEVKVGVGRVMGANTVIGLMGSTGNSSGAHLHLETRYSTDPNCPFWKATLFDPSRMYRQASR